MQFRQAGEHSMVGHLTVSGINSTSRTASFSMGYLSTLVVGTMLLLAIVTVQGAPLPAQNLDNCHSNERCCLPPYAGQLKIFEFNSTLPMRTRIPDQLADNSYIAKLEKAYELLRALPDSDPRSWINQANLHCLYCDDAITYDNVTYPLEIHNGWFFMPWHRLFIYFHERILAKLLGDDTFALPYWNWDNQSPVEPLGNILPPYYTITNSSLYDANRNPCAQPPNLVDLNSLGFCITTPPDVLRTQNNRLLYTQIVLGSVTPRLFFGAPYHLGDAGGLGAGTVEDEPHGPVHAWTGDILLPNDADMGRFETAARDPIFWAHHSNVDRLWTIWKDLPGGNRHNIADNDWLASAFVFIDENGDRVVANVSQTLDPELLRYNYQTIGTPWTTNGVDAGGENQIPLCFPASTTQIQTSISITPPISSAGTQLVTELTFRVPRPSNSTGFEILVLDGISMDFSQEVHVQAYLFYPTANLLSSVSCPEFLGTFNNIPHTGQAASTPNREWKAAIGGKLEQIGRDYVSDVVVTLVKSGQLITPLTIASAKVIYENV